MPAADAAAHTTAASSSQAPAAATATPGPGSRTAAPRRRSRRSQPAATAATATSTAETAHAHAPRRGRDRRRRDGGERENGEQVGAAQRDHGCGHRHRRQGRAADHAGHPQHLAEPEREHVVAQQRDVQRRPGLPVRQPGQHPPPGPRPHRERRRVEDERADQGGRAVGDGPQRRRQRGPVDHPEQIRHRGGEDAGTEPAPRPAQPPRGAVTITVTSRASSRPRPPGRPAVTRSANPIARGGCQDGRRRHGEVRLA